MTGAMTADLYAGVLAVDIGCIVFATICVGLRFYVRKVVLGKAGLDDWLLIAAVVAWTASLLSDIAAWTARKRLGHANEDPGHVLEMIDILFYLFAEVLVRGAWTAFYLKLVPLALDLRWHRYVLLTFYSAYSALLICIGFLFLFHCGIPKLVEPAGARCVSDAVMGALFKAIYYTDAIFDWLMVLIPLRVVWCSTLPRSVKYAATSILLLGCCAGGLALLVIRISLQVADYSTGTADNVRLGVHIDWAANCETMVAMLCLSLAALKPLVNRKTDAHAAGIVEELPSPGIPDLVLQREEREGDDKKRPAMSWRMLSDSSIAASEPSSAWRVASDADQPPLMPVMARARNETEDPDFQAFRQWSVKSMHDHV